MRRFPFLALAFLALAATPRAQSIQADLDYIVEQSLAVNRLSAGLRLTTDGAAILWTTRLTGTTRIPADGVLVDVDGGTVSVRCADGSECIEGISGNSEGARFREFAIYPALSASPETAEVARRLRAVLERIAEPPPSGGSLAELLTGTVERADANVEAAFVDGLLAAVDQLLAADGDFASLRGSQRDAVTWSGLLRPLRTTDAVVRCTDGAARESCTYAVDFAERSEVATRALADRFESHLGWTRQDYARGQTGFFECDATSRDVRVAPDYLAVTAGQTPGPLPDACPAAQLGAAGRRLLAAVDTLLADGAPNFAAFRGDRISQSANGSKYRGLYAPADGSALNGTVWCRDTSCTYSISIWPRLAKPETEALAAAFADAHPGWQRTHTDPTRGSADFVSCGDADRGVLVSWQEVTVKLYSTYVTEACRASASPPLADGGPPAPAPLASARPPIPPTGTGCLVGDCQNGYGAMRSSTGATYAGDWQDGAPTGRGVGVYADGGRYEGDFVAGVKQGRGVYTWIDGRRYDGEFDAGELSGTGIMIQADGTVQSGRWAAGRFQESPLDIHLAAVNRSIQANPRSREDEHMTYHAETGQLRLVAPATANVHFAPETVYIDDRNPAIYVRCIDGTECLALWGGPFEWDGVGATEWVLYAEVTAPVGQPSPRSLRVDSVRGQFETLVQAAVRRNAR